MLVRMLTLAASPEAILQAGKTYNLPSTKAKQFIDGGFAEPSRDKATRIPPQPDPEDVPELPEEEELVQDEDDEE